MPEPLYTNSITDKLVLFPACDPKYKLVRIFKSDSIENKPELVILNWLVCLPYEIDPALAAQSVLLTLEKNRALLSDDQKSILTLLSEIACHPRDKLLNPASGKTRGHRRRHCLR